MSRADDLRKIAVLPSPSRGQRVPRGFDTCSVGAQGKQWLNEEAISIFTDMANNGHPFADCLGAVLATGMHYAMQGIKQKEAE